MATDTNTISPAEATAAIPKMRIKHAFSYGICRGTEAGVRIIDSTADVVGAIAVRVKLHNISTAADIIDEMGPDKVNQAQDLISKL